MRQVSIEAARSQFSKLIKEVENGGQVVLTRDGRPAAKLVRFDVEMHSDEAPPKPSGHPTSG